MTYYTDYCLKCTYRNGMFRDEKQVIINTPDGKDSFFTWDSELTFVGEENALVRLLFGVKKLDEKWALVCAREEGNPHYFRVPLSDIVKEDVKQ